MASLLVGLGFEVELDAEGKLHSSELSPVQRREFLIEEIGLAERIVDSMPADHRVSATHEIIGILALDVLEGVASD